MGAYVDACVRAGVRIDQVTKQTTRDKTNKEDAAKQRNLFVLARYPCLFCSVFVCCVFLACFVAFSLFLLLRFHDCQTSRLYPSLAVLACSRPWHARTPDVLAPLAYPVPPSPGQQYWSKL